MSKLNAAPFTVIDTQPLSPHMRRLIVKSDAITAYPEDAEGGYIKLVFPQPGQDKPLLRTYTIAQIDFDRRAMAVDFVLHEDGGPAATWAVQASVGDEIAIAGPGPAKPVNLDADWFLIAGDMTALPAIRSNLRSLPADAQGYLVLEVASEADKAALDIPVETLPAGLELIWLVNPHPGDEKVLSNAIQVLEWQEGEVAIWLAGELDEVLKARSFLRAMPGVTGKRMYISSYWQFGMTEDRHKAEKQKRLSA